MRVLIIFLFILGISNSMAEDFDCKSQFLKEAKELLASDHQGLLGKQFQLTTLKLAKKTLVSDKTNLEAVIRKYGRDIDNGDKRVLGKLESLYQKHGMTSDYKKIIENFKTASYWNKETRFYNQDVSMFILAKKTLDPEETDLNNSDAAITWFAQKLGQESGEKNSKSFNLTNISSHVAALTGAIKGYPKKSLASVNSQIKEVLASLESGFDALKDDLSLSFKKKCLDSGARILSCETEEELFSMAIDDLAGDIGNDKIYQFSLESEVKKRFGGIVDFKIRTNLKEYAKQKAWMASPPKKPFKIGFPYPGLEDYQKVKSWQIELNKLDDEQMIKSFQNQAGKKNYGILDKAKSVLTIYSKEGLVLATLSTKLNKSHRDEKDNSGSGIYKIQNSGSALSLTDQRGLKSNLKLTSHALDCGTGEACIKTSNASELIQKYLMPDGQLYILPYDGINHFQVKNSKLNHTTEKKTGPYFDTNYSPKGKVAFPIEIDITDPRYKTETSKEFVAALEKEKETIMNLYNLDNDEYNDLARYAFGIMGNESEFGENWRYDVKEAFPFGVAFIKDTKKNIFGKTEAAYSEAKEKEGLWSGIKAGTSTYFKELIKRDVRLLTGGISGKQNSRGPTQIKTVPKKIAEHYKVDKDNISTPKNSAVATMGFLAEAMVELKNRAKKNPAITKENRMDYLHYIYMGSTHEIKNKTATPEKNIYLRQLKEYLKGIKIYQRVSL